MWTPSKAPAPGKGDQREFVLLVALCHVPLLSFCPAVNKVELPFIANNGFAILIVLVGGTGNLGTRVAKVLVSQQVEVLALVRPSTPKSKRFQLDQLGVRIETCELARAHEVAQAITGASCVVSTLLGVRDVIIDAQSILLDAIELAGVPRFIPSDYALDFTKTKPGNNRNLDLHREFLQRVASSNVRATSILNGAFMDLLKGQAPIIQRPIHRVLYWESPNQMLDFTTMDDTAAYTARAAMDETTPRFLRIAGDQISAKGIAAAMSELSNREYKLLKAGSVSGLRLFANGLKLILPAPHDPFPAWQGMQYCADMFEGNGKLSSLDNDRYADIRFTSFREFAAREL